MVYWGDILSIPSAKLSNASRQCDIALVEEMKGDVYFINFIYLFILKITLLVIFNSYFIIKCPFCHNSYQRK